MRVLHGNKYTQSTDFKLFNLVLLVVFGTFIVLKKLKTIQMSFSACYVERRTKKSKFFREINAIIDWDLFEKEIGKYYSKGSSATGRPSYSGIILFKMLLLGMWYNLSDDMVEEMVLDSLSAMQFCGLELEDQVPDSTTLCRFRNHLTKAKAWDKLLLHFNNQLKRRGIMLREGSAKIDASLTSSGYQRPIPKSFEIATDRKENERSESAKDRERLYYKKLNTSKDPEARWVKKAGKYVYGYKKSICVDEEGMIESVATGTASEHDSKHFKRVLNKVPKIKKKSAYADKAYKSKEHDEYLKRQKIKNRTQYRAYKNTPLSYREKAFNKGVSKKRWVVERTFGAIKKWFKSTKSRYIGIAKTHSQHLLEAIAHNLKRSPGLVWKKQII